MQKRSSIVLMIAKPTITNLRIATFFAILSLIGSIWLFGLAGYYFFYVDKGFGLVCLCLTAVCAYTTSLFFSEVVAMIVRLVKPDAPEN